jgi:hypothetical protein
MGRQDHSIYKRAVRAATTADITLSGLQTIDSVAVGAGQRVLVKDQTAGAENGIWIADAGAWSRATDWDHVNNVVPGAMVPVSEGANWGDTSWKLTTDDPILVGTTVVSFAIALAATSGAAAPGSFHLHEEFWSAAGDALPGHWTSRSAGGGVIVTDYSDGQGGGYLLRFDATLVQDASLYNNDVLTIPCTVDSNTVVEIGFEYTKPVLDVNDDMVIGIGSARAAFDAMTRSCWLRVDGANNDILIEGDDNVTNVSFDSGLDYVDGTLTKVRFDFSDLTAVTAYLDIGAGWVTVGTTMNLPNLAAGDHQIFCEMDKNSANVHLLEIKYVDVRYTR